MTTPTTIKDAKELPIVMQACDEVQMVDLLKNLPAVIQALQDSLKEKIKEVEDFKHTTPAYLAANQIGHRLRVVLLYLPDQKAQIAMINPTYEILEEAPDQPQYRISTFLMEQVRFRNNCYAQKIRVHYQDPFTLKPLTLVLEGNAAIAAQMGIQFINGKTPLDNVPVEELRQYAAGTLKPNEKNKIVSTKEAYLMQGREIDPKQNQFGSDQKEFIEAYLELRKKFPILYNPCTGKKLVEKLNEEPAKVMAP